jgi:hypothetical protein
VTAIASPALAADTGNGAISGPHYNLNLIGMKECPTQAYDDTGRHNIHVLLNYSDDDADNIVGDDPGTAVTLNKTNKIFLFQGDPIDGSSVQDDFAVLDGNACDGDGAAFMLPENPFTCDDADCEEPRFQEYWVFVRELGTPGGTGDLRTCAISDGGTESTADDEVVCSSENVLLVRTSGRSKFENKTKELTTMVIQVDTDGDGDLETVRIGIFDPLLYSYFWDYDNNGLRLVQLRFIPVPPAS